MKKNSYDNTQSKIVLSKAMQKSMLEFFAKTSIPKMAKKKRSHDKP